MPGALPLPHLFIALAVIAVWGTNFVVIKIALAELPPLLLATLRFAIAFFPVCLVLPRPQVPLAKLAAYGLLIGVGQFGALYLAMDGHITPGLASLVVQVQIFFTIALSVWFQRQTFRAYQGAALLVAVAGIVVILAHTDADTTPLGLALVLLAALAWGCGNMVSMTTPGVNMLAYVVWASAFAVPPLFVLSLLHEGWPAMSAGIARADAAVWAAVVWQSAGNTMFGYALWGWLLGRHPAATVAPLALLIPVFGIGASAWWLGEPLQGWKLAAGALVIGGLTLNLLWPRIAGR